ncbi:hypothetical protein EZI54_19010 [Marinobacter halodurans]|uniref:Uncharacterized protein n=1 Tax=Marinobacter halodurans TaxID=2528979 RepID=A0ABY1ZJP8_9GAMM|nr:hypothetical protein [Marinobacter halodurans]TBW49806.1 hypothetical protein EZI54_19010 [Marinobacter halodurans]
MLKVTDLHDPTGTRQPHQPNLNRHESVREHLQERLNREVADLEERIEALRRSRAPHTAIIIATYERMIDRKKGFMSTWGMGTQAGSQRRSN